MRKRSTSRNAAKPIKVTLASAGPLADLVPVDTHRAEQGIDAEILKARATTNKRDTRRGHRNVVRVEPAVIVLRRAGFRMSRRPRHPKPNRPTMTLGVVVGVLSPTTHWSRHSINAPHVRHVRLGPQVARVHNLVVLFPTMRPRNSNRLAAIRHNVARLAAHAVTAKRAIANCPRVAEANGQHNHRRRDR